MTLDNDLLWIRLIITTCDNQPDGRGSLRMDDGTVFAPNDFYPLKKETFRLYYTSETTDQQQIDVYVYDSFGQRFDLNFSFQNDSDKENEGASS